MADSILRLKVDSQEYDQKIKRAAEGIQQYAQKCRDAGGTLQYLDDGVLEFVQALGKMDTVATGTKQQLREMSNALTTLTQTYRGLTDEEKASPFGQELAKGIQQLTERAGQAQDAMADVQASIRNAASDTRLFDQMAQGMSVATAGFQGLTGAGKMLGIEMGNDVEVIAKLQAAMAVTNSLTTIQNALQKQSALMQGLNAAKTALAATAQQAYAVATGEATAAQVAFNVAASANPYMLILTAVGALAGVVAAFASTTGEATDALEDQKRVIDDITRSVNDAADAYRQLAEQMKSLGIGGKKEYDALIQGKRDQFENVRNAWLSVGFDKKKEEERNGRDTEKWKALDDEQKRLHDEMLKVKKEYEDLQRANKERVRRLNQYARLDFSDVTTQSEAQSALSFLKEQQKYKDPTSRDYGNIKRAIEYVENILLPQFQDKTEEKANTRANKVGEDVNIISKSIGDYERQIRKLKATEKDVTTNEEWEALQHRIGELTIKVKELKGELSVVPASIKDITGGINAATDAQNKKIQDRLNDPNTVSKGMADLIVRMEKDRQKGDKKEDKKLTDGLSALASGFGGIQSGFQQLGIDLGSGFNEVVNGIQGITSILTAIQSIVTAIEIISSVPFFSNGGIVHAAGGYVVPGNRMSGDGVPALLNSQEMVLNRQQQMILAGTLENGGMDKMRLEAVVKGEQIHLVQNRFLKRTGQGEIVTWR